MKSLEVQLNLVPGGAVGAARLGVAVAQRRRPLLAVLALEEPVGTLGWMILNLLLPTHHQFLDHQMFQPCPCCDVLVPKGTFYIEFRTYAIAKVHLLMMGANIVNVIFLTFVLRPS